jgi:hypothetical protein
MDPTAVSMMSSTPSSHLDLKGSDIDIPHHHHIIISDTGDQFKDIASHLAATAAGYIPFKDRDNAVCTDSLSPILDTKGYSRPPVGLGSFHP